MVRRCLSTALNDGQLGLPPSNNYAYLIAQGQSGETLQVSHKQHYRLHWDAIMQMTHEHALKMGDKTRGTTSLQCRLELQHNREYS